MRYLLKEGWACIVAIPPSPVRKADGSSIREVILGDASRGELGEGVGGSFRNAAVFLLLCKSAFLRAKTERHPVIGAGSL